jgi:hypothetical protein
MKITRAIQTVDSHTEGNPTPRRGVIWVVLILSGCALALLPLDMLSVRGTVSFELAAWATRLARAAPLLCGLAFWLVGAWTPRAAVRPRDFGASTAVYEKVPRL